MDRKTRHFGYRCTLQQRGRRAVTDEIAGKRVRPETIVTCGRSLWDRRLFGKMPSEGLPAGARSSLSHCRTLNDCRWVSDPPMWWYVSDQWDCVGGENRGTIKLGVMWRMRANLPQSSTCVYVAPRCRSPERSAVPTTPAGAFHLLICRPTCKRPHRARSRLTSSGRIPSCLTVAAPNSIHIQRGIQPLPPLPWNTQDLSKDEMYEDTTPIEIGTT